jgi:hypothetical protein
MKVHRIALPIVFLALTATADPSPNIGRILPRLELLTGETYTRVEITAADADGITINDEGTEVVISRYALSPEARVALGFPEEADKNPIPSHFRIVQVGEEGYIVRFHTPPASSGSAQSLTNQIFGRSSDDSGRPSDGDKLYLLNGKTADDLADGDIIDGYYVSTDSTKSFTTVTGAKATVRVLLLITSNNA